MVDNSRQCILPLSWFEYDIYIILYVQLKCNEPRVCLYKNRNRCAQRSHEPIALDHVLDWGYVNSKHFVKWLTWSVNHYTPPRGYERNRTWQVIRLVYIVAHWFMDLTLNIYIWCLLYSARWVCFSNATEGDYIVSSLMSISSAIGLLPDT